MHRTRLAAACATAIASTISRRNCWCRHGAARRRSWTRVELFTADNAQFPDLSAHSFRDSSTGRSTWWDRVFALEDFLEMAVNLSTVSKWKKELDVLGEWLHYDEATVRQIASATFCASRIAFEPYQKLQHRRVRAWHYRERARKRQRCQAFEIGHLQEGRFSWATPDEND